MFFKDEIEKDTSPEESVFRVCGKLKKRGRREE